jgi:Lrp/AsnC family leucine-responsive transcriptional regulator
MKHLDEVDVKLLALLQADGRITNTDLAKQVDLSPPSVLQRVRALENAGLVRGYTAVLDAERLGFKLTALTFVSLTLHQDLAIERFRKAVTALPEVLECYHISGDADFVLKVVVRDMRAYEGFIREKLAKIKSIGRIQTSFVLGTAKHTSHLPL